MQEPYKYHPQMLLSPSLSLCLPLDFPLSSLLFSPHLSSSLLSSSLLFSPLLSSSLLLSPLSSSLLSPLSSSLLLSPFSLLLSPLSCLFLSLSLSLSLSLPLSFPHCPHAFNLFLSRVRKHREEPCRQQNSFAVISVLAIRVSILPPGFKVEVLLQHGADATVVSLQAIRLIFWRARLSTSFDLPFAEFCCTHIRSGRDGASTCSHLSRPRGLATGLCRTLGAGG